MAGRSRYTWPEPDAIIESLRKLGSRAEVARQIGCPQRTLDSHLQKMGIRDRAVQAVNEWRAENVDGAPKPDEPVAEEEILRQRVQELESYARKERKEEVKEERLRRALADSMAERHPVYKPLRIPKAKQPDRHEFVLLWSDTHVPEVVSLEETNGINEYDYQIALARHDQLRRGLLSFLDNRPYPVRKLTVLALGDMLSGNIHDELAETNEFPLAEATIQFGLDAAEWLDSFTPHFERIHFVGVGGNHPRMFQKPRAKQAGENFDRILYETMRLRLKRSESIEFDIPKAAAWPVTVAERWRILATHGDGVRSTMAGVPWGGLMRHCAALQNQYTAAGKAIDVFAVGHYHTANVVEFPAGRIAMNGSVKGVDEYSLRRFGGGRGPQQVLLTFHPERGLTDVSFIDLEQVQPAGVREVPPLEEAA